MGAFSYEPASAPESASGSISNDDLDLYCRQAAMLTARIESDLEKSIFDALEYSGGSAGGMRPKMLLAIQISVGDTGGNASLRRDLVNSGRFSLEMALNGMWISSASMRSRKAPSPLRAIPRQRVSAGHAARLHHGEV